MYEEDEDLLEDVIIENKQALEMAEIYTNILMSMMDSFSSIISNRLSQIMKFLTSVTIILATPTLIYSLWGINVPVPFESSALRLRGSHPPGRSRHRCRHLRPPGKRHAVSE